MAEVGNPSGLVVMGAEPDSAQSATGAIDPRTVTLHVSQ